MKTTFKRFMTIGILLSQLTFAHAQNREATEHGNGGDFTEQDIYLEISEIANDLVNLKKFSFGISGDTILSELSKNAFLVVITDQVVLDRNNKKKDAVNFAPNEIDIQELLRYDISPSDRARRIIVASRTSWGQQLVSGRSIKNLSAHELWGTMGLKDVGYQYTSPYFEKMAAIAENPTAYLCYADCGAHSKYWYRGYGTSMKAAFKDLERQCTHEMLFADSDDFSSPVVTDAHQVCHLNI